MKSICFICSEYPPARHGGIGTFIQGLARELVQSRKVIVVGFDPGVEVPVKEKDGEITVYRFPEIKRQKGRLASYRHFVASRKLLSHHVEAVLRSDPVDVVESYEWSGPLWTKPAVPLIVRLHGSNSAHAFSEGKKPLFLLQWSERRNIQMADQVCAVSEHMANLTRNAFGLRNMPVAVIYNGVDTKTFRPLGDEREPQTVLYAGSIHPRKGIAKLFEAIPLVKKECPQARFALVGNLPVGGMQAPFIQQLLATIPREFHEDIEFVGHVAHREMPKWYSKATLAVFPSKAEAFGLTCAEAMACETPVIMTERASGPELVQHEQNGLLVDPASETAIAAAIIRFLGDSSLRMRCGIAGRKSVLERFDSGVIVRQNEEFYGGI